MSDCISNNYHPYDSISSDLSDSLMEIPQADTGGSMKFMEDEEADLLL
jgi:hypothetical protein